MLDGDRLVLRRIDDVVRKRQRAKVAAFDPDTFEVGYHEITGWYEGPPDRIYEVELRSGRRVRVTAGHNLFTLDRAGQLRKVRTGELEPGLRVAVPRVLPDLGVPPSRSVAPPEIVVIDNVPDPAPPKLSVVGPDRGRRIHARPERARRAPDQGGVRGRGSLPPSGSAAFRRRCAGPRPPRRPRRRGQVRLAGGRNPIPARFSVDLETAWLLGLYVAEGFRREQQVVLSNTDQRILDRAGDALAGLGLTFHRGPGALSVGSAVFSALLDWLGTGGKAPTKRIPPAVFGWPRPHLRAFLDGIVDGDGSTDGGRTSVWTTSDGLVGDLLLLFARLGRAPGAVADRPEAMPSRRLRSTPPTTSTSSSRRCRCPTCC